MSSEFHRRLSSILLGGEGPAPFPTATELAMALHDAFDLPYGNFINEKLPLGEVNAVAAHVWVEHLSHAGLMELLRQPEDPVFRDAPWTSLWEDYRGAVGFATVYRDLIGAQPIPFDPALRRVRCAHAFEVLRDRIAYYERLPRVP